MTRVLGVWGLRGLGVLGFRLEGCAFGAFVLLKSFERGVLLS